MNEMLNLYNTEKGLKKVEYKTEKSLIRTIKRINKSCIDLGYCTKLEIVLPVPRTWNHKKAHKIREVLS